MKVVITGSRDWTDRDAIISRFASLPRHTHIIHGGARGADRLAGYVGLALGFRVSEVRANWELHGKAAGYIRNLELLDLKPDLVIAFWDGSSRGTKHTIQQAKKRGIPVDIVTAM